MPDIAAVDEGDGIGDSSDTDGEPYDDEVGVDRAGRLVEGVDEDTPYAYLYARDIGVDGSAASAEEAAVHIVIDDAVREPGARRARSAAWSTCCRRARTADGWSSTPVS
ncbi:DUF5709 domain-containing protein [Actinophytocola sp. NPDC049390]|uniref:DUF5709 domain-containing protein n=1 Tax=Actinophytocola sp. NPDC049390 TaxID=3363894 RepID=UPI0037A21F04